MASETHFAETEDARTADQRLLIGVRLAVGAVQGLALYLLYRADDGKFWPATDPYWMAPLLMVFVFVPLLFQQAVGTLRLRTLLLWTAAAALILAGLAWYDIWRQYEQVGLGGDHGDGAMTFALMVFSVVGLFIAQALITAADTERKYIASYAAYFDVAWKFEIQLLLAAVFVGVFWGVLWLGATLFNLINLKFIEDLIEKSWFAIPATTLATAAALHVTDVRARLVGGIRTVAHTLLSWLLPLMVLIAVGFTLSLPFTGLAPLWATKSAAGSMLSACGVLVILINAAFQDGDPAHNRTLVLRYAELAAALVLVPLVLIAAYALWLRVGQYGWTVERIATAATIVVATVYAFGYAAAAVLSLRGGVWMALVEHVNIGASFLVLTILLLMFSPLGDPARLSVNSQVARLENGAVAPKAFDFDYLRTEGGRYGRAALTRLASGEFGANTAAIRKMAKLALAGMPMVQPVSKADLASNITVYPSGRSLPQGLLEVDWTKNGSAPSCLTMPGSHCDAFFADFAGNGSEDVVLLSGSGSYFYGTIFHQGHDKAWVPVANVTATCAGMLDALKAGTATTVAPSGMRDWLIKGVRIHPTLILSADPACSG